MRATIAGSRSKVTPRAGERTLRELNIGNFEVKHGIVCSSKVFTWNFPRSEHQPYAATIEETHIGDLKQKLHSELIAIKGDRLFGLRDVDSDLADSGKAEIHNCSVRQIIVAGARLVKRYSRGGP